MTKQGMLTAREFQGLCNISGIIFVSSFMKMGQLAEKLIWDRYLHACLCAHMDVRIRTDTKLVKIFLNSDLFFNIYDTQGCGRAFLNQGYTQ
jgi:hypothetical protein